MTEEQRTKEEQTAKAVVTNVVAAIALIGVVEHIRTYGTEGQEVEAKEAVKLAFDVAEEFIEEGNRRGVGIDKLAGEGGLL